MMIESKIYYSFAITLFLHLTSNYYSIITPTKYTYFAGPM
jgi:hypothetical protein